MKQKVPSSNLRFGTAVEKYALVSGIVLQFTTKIMHMSRSIYHSRQVALWREWVIHSIKTCERTAKACVFKSDR